MNTTLRPRSVIDVLAALPAAELRHVREQVQRELVRLRAEIRRLEQEKHQLGEAMRGKRGD